ncbi:MAG TPA: DUF998 domain-containing protein [Anaerolineales bacterium]|nr:DUF998 domain-containing protein [Anaerolineales bacterium]
MTKKQFSLGGVAASATFVAMLILFSALTPGYSHLTQAVSELGMSNAPYAFLWNLLGFGLVGVLILVFAWSLYLEFNAIRGGLFISALTGISGLGYMGLGIFPASIGFQPSTATTLHTIMVLISFFTFIVAAFAFGVSLRNDPAWKRWAIFSAVMGAIGFLSFAIPRSVPLGVSQRIGLGANFVWLLIMGYVLYRKPGVKE